MFNVVKIVGEEEDEDLSMFCDDGDDVVVVEEVVGVELDKDDVDCFFIESS